MKRLLAILPLMITVFLAPSCKITIGGDDTSFTCVGTTKKGSKEATISINWENGAHLSFDNDGLQFVVDGSTPEVDKVGYNGESTISPRIVEITFKENISSNFKGRLDFSYTNIDTGASAKNQVTVEFNV